MISIIIASYNKGDYILETINSVLQQSFTDWELIIVDDASTDQTAKTLETFSDNKKIKVLFNDSNSGANFCRNVGLKYSSGKYIIFMDADDLLTPFCLQSRYDLMEKCREVDFAVSTMGVFFTKVGDSKDKWFPEVKDPLGSFLKHEIPWSIMQPTWKSSYVKGTEGFDVSFQRLQDVEFHTRVLFDPNVRFTCVNSEPDCFYRIEPARMNFDTFVFLERWFGSSVKYCNKFCNIARKQNKSTYLLGTLYRSYLQALNFLKARKITEEQFIVLENMLFEDLEFTISAGQKMLFRLSRFFNLLPFRIKGVNWIINKCLIS